MPSQNSHRLSSIDLFRGLTVILMIIVNNPGNPKLIFWPLEHAEWDGLTPTDLVFPFFVFAVGLSIAVSISEKTSWTKILRRTITLFMIGIFLNRKNLIVLLMAIELMLLAVNMNFVAFSHYLGDMHGQVFVFFILTVAAAESAIGLAILVLLFRNQHNINVDELNSLKG